jgi:hypothetical protein
LGCRAVRASSAALAPSSSAPASAIASGAASESASGAPICSCAACTRA